MPERSKQMVEISYIRNGMTVIRCWRQEFFFFVYIMQTNLPFREACNSVSFLRSYLPTMHKSTTRGSLIQRNQLTVQQENYDGQIWAEYGILDPIQSFSMV